MVTINTLNGGNITITTTPPVSPSPYFTYDSNRVITGLYQGSPNILKETRWPENEGDETYVPEEEWSQQEDWLPWSRWMLGNKNIVDNYAFGINSIFNDGYWEPYYDEPQSISLPNATSIGDYAFDGCQSLTSISIPNVTSIGDYAFQHCYELTSVSSLPNVTSIGEEAFYGCDNLTSITFEGKTLAQVQEMDNYPWGIEDTSIINVA